MTEKFNQPGWFWCYPDNNTPQLVDVKTENNSKTITCECLHTLKRPIKLGLNYQLKILPICKITDDFCFGPIPKKNGNWDPYGNSHSE